MTKYTKKIEVKEGGCLTLMLVLFAIPTLIIWTWNWWAMQNDLPSVNYWQILAAVILILALVRFFKNL